MGNVLHMFSEIPLLLFSLPPMSPNQFCGVTWQLFPSSPIYLLFIVVIFHSPVFAKCCSSCLRIIFTSSILILSIYFLVCNSFPSCCHLPNLEENLWLLDHQLLPNPPCIFHSCLVLMIGDVLWLIVESIFLHCLFPLSLSWFIGVY